MYCLTAPSIAEPLSGQGDRHSVKFTKSVNLRAVLA